MSFLDTSLPRVSASQYVVSISDFCHCAHNLLWRQATHLKGASCIGDCRQEKKETAEQQMTDFPIFPSTRAGLIASVELLRQDLLSGKKNWSHSFARKRVRNDVDLLQSEGPQRAKSEPTCATYHLPFKLQKSPCASLHR